MSLISDIHAEALAAAKDAVAKQSAKWIASHGSTEVAGACGFAWVNIYGVRKNSKEGKELLAVGFSKDDYEKAFRMSSHDWYNGQNVDIKEEGARAYAKVFSTFGFRAYASSRMD